MQQLSEDDSASVLLALRRFLHADTAGCDFVGYFAKEGRGIFWATLEGLPSSSGTAQVLSELIQQAQNENEAAGIVFPSIACDAQLTALVDALDGSDQWQVTREASLRSGMNVQLVRVCWINAKSERCSVLGMAPVLTMPATRRAPYVSMFIWPGPRSNQFRKTHFPEIGIGDMTPPPPLDESSYTALRKRTQARSRQMNAGDLPAGVTFVLPA